MNDPQWLESSIFMLSDLLSGWAGKVSISAGITFVCELFHVDYGLAVLCFCMLTADMVLRLIALAKRPKNLAKGLKKAIPRYIFYMLFIVMAWTVEFSVMRAVHIEIPFVDIVVAYLILTDCASVIEHLIHLGVPVPALISMAVLGSRRKLETTTKQTLDIDEEKDSLLKCPRKRKIRNDENGKDCCGPETKQSTDPEIQKTAGRCGGSEEGNG